jgi:hypothetical protein
MVQPVKTPDKPWLLLDQHTFQNQQTGAPDSPGGGPTVLLAASGIGVTPVGTISSTDLQSALAELDSEKLPATLTAIAGEALGGHRAVYIAADGKAYYAGPTTHARLCSGITTGAASIGTTATIQTDGEIIEPSWSWIDSEVVWLAATGLLTQTVPTTGMAFQVGVPMGPTRLRIEPQIIAQLV